MSRVPVVGGAADGVKVARGPGGVRYIDPVRERGFKAPAAGRHPYEFDNAAGEYVPAQTCPDCGAILKNDQQGIRPDPCPLCGHERGGAASG